jgi:hypothetical protein
MEASFNQAGPLVDSSGGVNVSRSIIGGGFWLFERCMLSCFFIHQKIQRAPLRDLAGAKNAALGHEIHQNLMIQTKI